jgi:hypothetical protein
VEIESLCYGQLMSSSSPREERPSRVRSSCGEAERGTMEPQGQYRVCLREREREGERGGEKRQRERDREAEKGGAVMMGRG